MNTIKKLKFRYKLYRLLIFLKFKPDLRKFVKELKYSYLSKPYNISNFELSCLIYEEYESIEHSPAFSIGIKNISDIKILDWGYPENSNCLNIQFKYKKRVYILAPNKSLIDMLKSTRRKYKKEIRSEKLKNINLLN